MKPIAHFRIWLVLAGLMLVYAGKSQPAATKTPRQSEEAISIEYPEVYELANIILALTDYGIQDKWQVRKDFPYYTEMREYFKPYEDHPLLDSANFSGKRWQEYLSFRTDAYAFTLNDRYELQRINDFQAFEIQTFDRYKPLIEDFARKSKFRDFFKTHRQYYDRVMENYRHEYLLSEMKTFLSREFGDLFAGKKYSVVISPFVYAQNLHRDIDSAWTADFPSVAKPIIEGNAIAKPEEKSSEIHTLFTEMDHGYVNPTTARFKVEEKFNESLWDRESGYAHSDNAVFNEYMTWAVFDIFNEDHFPAIADRINLNWHFQNETRGFIYSGLFAQKLKELYRRHQGKKKIKDLYPDMLDWAQTVQNTLSKPLLLNDSDTLKITGSKTTVRLLFSEPMVETPEFDLVLQFGQWEKQVVSVGKDHHPVWKNNGTELTFDLELPHKEEYYLLLNWWGVARPLVGKKGVSLLASSGLVVIGN